MDRWHRAATTSRTATSAPVVLVRSGVWWWLFPIMSVGFVVFAATAPIDTLGDRLGPAEIGGWLFAYGWALATSRYIARGSALVCVGSIRVMAVEAAAIERIEAQLAPTVVTREGRRWTMAAFRMSYTTGWWGRVTRRRVAALQNWLDAQSPFTVGGSRGVRRSVRWSTVAVGLLSATLAPLAPLLVSAVNG